MNKLVLYSIVFLLSITIVIALDSDRDGIDDVDDAYPFDYDNDGLPDEWEVQNGLRPDIDNAKADSDSDGLSDLEEFEAGTDPTSLDTDGDGRNDVDEILRGSDPTKKSASIGLIILLFVLIIIGGVGIYFAILWFRKHPPQNKQQSVKQNTASSVPYNPSVEAPRLQTYRKGYSAKRKAKSALKSFDKK